MPNLDHQSKDSISPTAYLVAQMKRNSDIPYTEEFAKLTRAQEVTDRLLDDVARRIADETDRDWASVRVSLVQLTSGLSPVVEARMKSIGDVVSRVMQSEGIRHVLDLATGLSQRPLLLSEDPSVEVVEGDLPAIIEMKRELYKTLLTTPRNNLHPVPANLLSPKEMHSAASLLRGKMVAICEGLLPYQNRTEKAITATHIRNALDLNGGMAVVSDVPLRREFEAILANPERRRFIEALMGFTGNRFEEGLFADEDDYRSFLDEAGLRDESETSMEYLIDAGRMSSLRKLGKEPETMRQILRQRTIHIWRPA
jgi:O-methyltransferase involved in polyketide biosynthesis